MRRQGVIQDLGRKYQDIAVELVKSRLKPSREVFEDIDVLAETIKRHGLLEPILVTRGIARFLKLRNEGVLGEWLLPQGKDILCKAG